MKRRIRIIVSVMLLLVILTTAGRNQVYAKTYKLSRSSLTLYEGHVYKLEVKGSPAGKVKWSSGNRKTATVSSSGDVKAKRAGKCTITAKIGTKKLKCTVTVKKKGSSIVPMTRLANYSYFRKYMTDTQFRKAYNIAYEMLLPLEGLGKKKQLMGIAVILRMYFENGMEYSMKAQHYNDPYGYLVLKCASCAGCARTTGLLLNMLGFRYEHVNENQYSHQWARVKLGKEYWICDAYGLYCGVEPAPRKHPNLS